MTTALTVAGIALGCLAFLTLVIVVGHRMIGSESSTSTFTDGMGSFMNVLDPARERADEDLRSQKMQGALTPSPEDDDRPVTVDLSTGIARIKRP